MTDTQRKDMISIYNGREDMHTPHLDQLARSGMRFEKGYTCQPVCGPARSALFTGTFPHTNGMVSNSMAFNEQARTIGQHLDEAGIHSAYIGKWHLDGGDYFGNGICPDGWDNNYWYDMRNYLDEMSEDDRYRSRQFSTCFEEDGIEESFTYAHKCTNRAIDFIEKHKDQDYLLVVSYDEPHGPFLSPQKYFEPFKNKVYLSKENQKMDTSNLPEHVKVWGAPYEYRHEDLYGLLGCNAYVDNEIGRLLDTIEGHADDAMVIYTSDHGDALGSHGISGKGPAMYDEITNIPFMVKWKDKVPSEGVDTSPVSHIDVVPTIMDVFDIDKPRYLTGKSLLPRLVDGQADEHSRAFIEFTRYEIDHDGFGGYQPVRCVVTDGFKLSINLMTEDELYDMNNDPEEMHNLIEDEGYKTIRNELHDMILQWMDHSRDPFRGYYWERRPWRADAPEASWSNHGMTRQRYTRKDETRQLDYDTGLEIKEFVRKK